MARRNQRQNAPEATEGTEPEATTEGSGSTATATTEKPKQVDLTDFKAAVDTAMTEADTTTGEVPEAALAKVTEEYRKLDGIKAKNEAKAHAADLMKSRMGADDLAGARAALNIQDKALVAAAGGSKGEKAPADPTENFVQRVATLTLGYQLATTSVPEGVDESWTEKSNALVSENFESAKAYLAWTQGDPESRGDEPEVSSVIRNAAKLAAGKAAKAGVSRGGGTFTGDRKDIGVHIENAFSDKEEGQFLTIAEIRNTRSDEYGDNPPSAGAISARLFPKSGTSSMEKVGIKPDTQNGKKGAVKVAVSE